MYNENKNGPEILDIDEVIKYSEEDRPLFDELYNVLEKYGATQRFGVTLLHTHFDLKKDEVLMESTNKVTRQQFIEPISKLLLDQIDSIETSWQLTSTGPKAELRCQIEQTSIPPQHVDRP